MFGLTPRQMAVARLLATGCSDKEISDALVIQVGTAQSHVASIMRVLLVDNRTKAALRLAAALNPWAAAAAIAERLVSDG